MESKQIGIECPRCKTKCIVSDRTIQLVCKCGLTWYGYDKKWHDPQIDEGYFE